MTRFQTRIKINNRRGTYISSKPVKLKKKQSTRLLKAECAECGYVVRVTAKWVNEVGAPRCGVKAHGVMVCDMPDEDGEGEE